MSWGGSLLAGAAGVVGLVVLGFAVLMLHILSARRQSKVVFDRRYKPLPRGPLPPLDTNPDGPRTAALRPWHTSRAPE